MKKIWFIILFCAFACCKKDLSNNDNSGLIIKFFGSSISEKAVDIINDGVGDNYILSCPNPTTNSYFIHLIKNDNNYKTIWDKKIVLSKNEQPASIVKSADALFILATVTDTTNIVPSIINNDLAIIKTDFNGNVIWTKYYGNSANQIAYKIIYTNDGFFYVLYSTDEQSNGDGNLQGAKDIGLSKFDKEGNLIFTQTYGGPNDDVPSKLIQLQSGELMIVGTTNSFSDPGQGLNNILVIKIDTNGNLLDRINLGTAFNDIGVDVFENYDGSFFVAGNSDRTNSNKYSILLYKLSPDIHQTLWSNFYGGNGNDLISSIKIVNGNIVLVGSTDSYSNGLTDIFYSVLNASGKQIFYKNFGDEGAETCANFFVYANSNIVILGTTDYKQYSVITLIQSTLPAN